MSGEPPGRAGRLGRCAVYGGIALACAAFWVCVWFGIISPLLDAWLHR